MPSLIFLKDCVQCLNEFEISEFINDRLEESDVCNSCINNKCNDDIYVDSAQNRTTAGTSWCSVTNSKGECIVSKYMNLFGDLKIEKKRLPNCERYISIVDFDSTNIMKNNSGELLAMVMGLRIAVHTNKKRTLFSDSNLMVKWWSMNRVNKLTLDKMDSRKVDLINECVMLRRKFEKIGGRVEWISGDKNPADLGYHK